MIELDSNKERNKMGLDMYLYGRKYVSKMNWDNSEAANNPQYDELLKVLNASNIPPSDSFSGVSVVFNVAYWRKANSIHGWFVDNVQRGNDDCGEYYVSREKLEELLDIVKNALSDRDPSELPPTAGFFFGSNDVDEHYWWDLENTKTQIERVLELPEFDDLDFYYQSSW